MRQPYARFVVMKLLLGASVACTSSHQPEPAVLTLHIAEQIHLDGEVVELQTLTEYLSESATKQPTYIIYEVAPEAPMAVFNGAMRRGDAPDAALAPRRAVQSFE